MFPTDVSPEDLLKNADVAMYQAKKDGRDSIRMFSAEMQEAVDQRRVVEKGLRAALENDEFVLYFQAQYDSVFGLFGRSTMVPTRVGATSMRAAVR